MGGNVRKPYRETLQGRTEDVLRRASEVSRRIGAGSVAVLIGALGAAALLATTLIFPSAPVQEVFTTTPDVAEPLDDFARVTRDRREQTIRVAAAPDGEGKDNGSPDEEGVEGPSGDEATQVLAAPLESGQEATGSAGAEGGSDEVRLDADDSVAGGTPPADGDRGDDNLGWSGGMSASPGGGSHDLGYDDFWSADEGASGDEPGSVSDGSTGDPPADGSGDTTVPEQESGAGNLSTPGPDASVPASSDTPETSSETSAQTSTDTWTASTESPAAGNPATPDPDTSVPASSDTPETSAETSTETSVETSVDTSTAATESPAPAPDTATESMEEPSEGEDGGEEVDLTVQAALPTPDDPSYQPGEDPGGVQEPVVIEDDENATPLEVPSGDHMPTARSSP